MMTIWGRENALGVQKVIWAAQEVGRLFRRIDAGQVHGVVDTPEYRRLNPNGKVPTIEDDGLILWESNVIVRYLCARYGGADLYPADLSRRMDAERWMDWQTSDVLPVYRVALGVFGRGAVDRAPADVAEQCFRDTNTLLGMLDAELAHKRFVAGDAFTMGDIPIGVTAHNWFQIDRPMPPVPNLRRWYADLNARPAAAWLMSTRIRPAAPASAG